MIGSTAVIVRAEVSVARFEAAAGIWLGQEWEMDNLAIGRRGAETFRSLQERTIHYELVKLVPFSAKFISAANAFRTFEIGRKDVERRVGKWRLGQ